MSILLRTFRITQLNFCTKCVPKVNLSTTVPKKALPPFLVLMAKPLSRVLAMIVGRRARKWWQKLPEAEKEKYRSKRIRNGQIFGFSSVFLAALAGFGYQSHLEECPLTGNDTLNRHVCLNGMSNKNLTFVFLINRS